MKEKSVGIIQRAVWCRIVGFMLAMLIHLTGAEALFAQDDVSAGSDDAADAVEQANDSIPPGTWEVTQVRLEKNTDGEIQRATNSTTAAMKESVRFPLKLEIKESRNILLYYDDSKEGISAEYTLEEGQLKIMSVGIALEFRYSLSDEQLTLAFVHRYANRKSADKVENVTENWTVTLERKEIK